MPLPFSCHCAKVSTNRSLFYLLEPPTWMHLAGFLYSVLEVSDAYEYLIKGV